MPPQPRPVAAGVLLVVIHHGAGLVDQSGDLLVAGDGELHQQPERADGEEHGGEIVQRHGDQQRPGGPLREHGEPEGHKHPDDDQVALREQDGDDAPAGEHRHRPHDGEVEQEKREGDAVKGEIKSPEEEGGELASHENQDEEGGEGHVVPEEGSPPEVKEENQEEGDGGDDGDEYEGVDQGAAEFLRPRGGAGSAGGIGEGEDGGGGRGVRGVGEGSGEEDDEEHTDWDRGDDADDLLSQGVDDARRRRRLLRRRRSHGGGGHRRRLPLSKPSTTVESPARDPPREAQRDGRKSTLKSSLNLIIFILTTKLFNLHNKPNLRLISNKFIHKLPWLPWSVLMGHTFGQAQMSPNPISRSDPFIYWSLAPRSTLSQTCKP